ncbi:MAG: glucose-6-phosphate isomerase [Zoogloeaceae bacterium]|nr:glucose-6-phosphate isomerase [Rhodocyclaceae bacterium]MCP5221342.1 glucose-6-phosphate isomerase [Zoogloeaceae bacterium]
MPDARSDLWSRVQLAAQQQAGRHLRDQFATDPDRATRMRARSSGIFIDYSKNRLDDADLQLLFDLADASGLRGAIDAMFAGERINSTEHRAVLHTALRAPASADIRVDGHNVVPGVHAEIAHMAGFAEQVRSGQWRGHTGELITNIVNIGIGGSDLGPRLVCDALRPIGHPRLRTHFVANVDAGRLNGLLRQLDRRSTLFVVCSKSFTTQETLTNARSARAWFLQDGAAEANISRHFVAVSTNAEAVTAFGIDPANMFGFWDWVGGRYSLWSAVGLSIMLQVGPAAFGELLAGAHAMDTHFQTAPWSQNLPVLLALLGVWYVNGFGTTTHMVAPYDHGLRQLPGFLQQLDMESNGKQTTRDGQPVGRATGPVVWGASGINGQHAFYQLLHQGSQLVPADFVATLHSPDNTRPHHDIVLANCIAQAQALMMGRTPDEARAEMESEGLSPERIAELLPHRCFAGNRPTNVILLDALSPRTLGALLAMYEHKVFTQGVLWNVNSFDQWGVELGKQLARRIESAFASGLAPAGADSSTCQLIDLARAALAARDDDKPTR